MSTACTGVILSGGMNTRMNRKNKAYLSIGGRDLIERILDVYRTFFDDIILVTNNPDEYFDLDIRIVTDIIKIRCPLAGIHAGLVHAVNPWTLVLPCDLPFARKEMIQLLLDHIKDRYSVIIPESGKGKEALFAAYSKENIPAIEHALDKGNRKIQDFFKPGRVYHVSEKRLRSADPDLISFFNVNRPEDLEQALSMENLFKGQ